MPGQNIKSVRVIYGIQEKLSVIKVNFLKESLLSEVAMIRQKYLKCICILIIHTCQRLLQNLLIICQA